MIQKKYDEWFEDWILSLKHDGILNSSELFKLREYIDSLKKKILSDAKKYKKNLKKVKENKNYKIEVLKKDLSSIKNARNVSNQLRARIADLCNENEHLKKDNNIIRSENKKILNKNMKLKSEVSKLKNESFFRTSECKHDLSCIKDGVKDVRKIICDNLLNNVGDDMSSKLSKKCKELKRVKDNYGKQVRDNNSLKSQILKLMVDINVLNKKIKDKNEFISNLEKRVEGFSESRFDKRFIKFIKKIL